MSGVNEINGVKGVEIAFHNSNALAWVLKAVAELIPEATMSIYQNHIDLKGMDSAHVGFFDVKMHLDKLASHVKCADDNSFIIGFKTKAFLNFISQFEKNALHLEYAISGNDDSLTMYEPLFEKTGSKRKQRNESVMKLLDIESEELSVSECDDWIEVDIEAIQWKKIVNSAMDISDAISLTCKSDQFEYTCEGEIGNISRHLFSVDDNIIITKGKADIAVANVKLSLDKIKKGCFKIFSNPGDRMKLRVIDNKLCVFKYYLGDSTDPECTLDYYLAGKIQDDD